MLFCNVTSAPCKFVISVSFEVTWFCKFVSALLLAVSFASTSSCTSLMLFCNVTSAASLSDSFWLMSDCRSASAWSLSDSFWLISSCKAWSAVVICPNDASWFAEVASEAVTFPVTVKSPFTLALAPSVVSPATWRVEFKVVASSTKSVESIVATPCWFKDSYTVRSFAFNSSIVPLGE